ncbi:TIGR00296 family protein [Methanobrevibacter filiformis]|uniref:Protein MBFIL_02030 n=1 Tax=Methanobrevibacter filiformis TaxID=55758 RepID=A0A166F5F9_9EURY|nr:TIGR00296 family protein [Methanobrevibacter filiformis]KZX17334.1 hypothetical protein MBFIL_02030 [Methanobrevibacter filiformis]
MLSKENGEFLLDLSKTAIKKYVENHDLIKPPLNTPDELKEELGVFVTLNKNKQLRGCIGYPEPIFPLVEATINSAISAAFEDPRFPPVIKEEIPTIDIEITVLTKPKLIKVKDPKEYVDKIVIGKDGLIIEKEYNKGLLLPQVATEHNMNTEEFLSQTCIKAGLNYDAWIENNDNIKIYSFQGQIFK